MGTYTRFTDPSAEKDHILPQLTPAVLASHLWSGHGWERSGPHKLTGRCPNTSHKDDSPSFGLDFVNGRTVGHCFGCSFGGDALSMIADARGLDIQAEFPQVLDIAARMIGTTLEAVRRMLRDEPSFTEPARPKSDAGASADSIFAAAEEAKEKKRLKAAVRGADVAEFCQRLASVTTCQVTAAGLARRGIAPKLVAAVNAAGALPAAASLPDGIPGWAKVRAKHDDVEISVSWWETGHRLIVPLRKPQVVDGKRAAPIVNVRARYVGEGPIPCGLDKSLGAAGASNEGVFFLSESVLAWWEGRGPAPETFVFAEGEVDRLTVETTIGGRPDVGVVGIVSKSLCDEAKAFFDEIPAEATIISLLHSDNAGQGPDGYQPALHRLLGGRCPLKVLHLGPAPGPDGKPAKLPDENDLLAEMGYDGYDPLDPARLHDGYVPPAKEEKPEKEKKAGPANPADLIVKLAEKYGAELYVNDNQQACMTVEIGGRRMTYQVESGSMALELVGWVDDAFGITVSEQAVKQAATTLASRAYRRGARRNTFMRVGASARGDVLYLDLCDHTGAVVEVGAAGYRVLDKSPVPFLRRRNLKPLPKPAPGGKIDELWQLLNVRREDRPLVLAWLVAALRPGYPYPVLAFHGAKGTGKSTAARVLRTLIDPHVSRLRDAPEGRKQVSVAAQNSWVVCYDNLSKVSEWLSDTLCGLATETSFNDRALYKNDEEHAIVVRRPVIVTGIPELASEGDLGDRYLQVILDTIVDYAEEVEDEEQADDSPRRAEEAELWDHFDEAHPRLLGALLDAVSCALKHKAATKLSRGTRMMDFAVWACAAAPALGFTADEFLAAYRIAKENADATALESSVLVGPLRTYLDKGAPSGIDPSSTADMDQILAGRQVAAAPDPRLPSKTCSVAELYDDLKRIAGDDADWKRRGPKSSAQLSSLLRRLQPSLPQMGIKVELHARGATGRTVTISRIAPA